MRGNYPSFDNTDYSGQYFEFTAAQNSNTGNSEFAFLGTYVYYKIYSSSSTMISNNNSIEAVNNSTDYSAAAGRMLNYGYQELNTDGGFLGPFAAGAHVRIRLTNYQESVSSGITNKAQIEEVGGTQISIPRRSRGNSYSFDFGRKDKPGYSNNGINYDAPASGDDDFSGSAPSDNKYYVDMYAVAAGRDTTFTTYYSNVTYLGSITIDASVENN
ncbi:MAG: hypothetical protein HDR37_10510 [Treponema sp.]|nr:hypothetical protein [Treponema sp.]